VKILLRNWWPVALWLGIIRLESSDYGSARNSYGLLSRLASPLFGAADPTLLAEVNEVLRKNGHFFGYAILSGLVFLALRHSHRDCLNAAPRRTWLASACGNRHIDWAVIAVIFALVTASLDEIHQTFLRSRSGRWQDVAIDTSGALLMQLLLYRPERA
jgi:VanZ family protein